MITNLNDFRKNLNNEITESGSVNVSQNQTKELTYLNLLVGNDNYWLQIYTNAIENKKFDILQQELDSKNIIYTQEQLNFIKNQFNEQLNDENAVTNRSQPKDVFRMNGPGHSKMGRGQYESKINESIVSSIVIDTLDKSEISNTLNMLIQKIMGTAQLTSETEAATLLDEILAYKYKIF